MQRLASTLVIAMVSFFTSPALAQGLVCPATVVLPRTLGLHGSNPSRGQIHYLQAYLTNLRRIAAAYQAAPTNPRRNQIANCMLDHLVTLPDNHSLLQPATRADIATLHLFRAEVQNSLDIIQPHLRNKNQVAFINAWQAANISYTPVILATR